MKNKNYKASPSSPEESERIQRFWIDNYSAKWANSSKTEIEQTDEPYLYLENGLITYGSTKGWYDNKKLPIFSLPNKQEITLDDLEIGMEVMLKPWGKVGDRKGLGKHHFNRKVTIKKIDKIHNNFKGQFDKSDEWWYYHPSSIDHIIKNDNKMKDKRFPFEVTEEQFKQGLQVCCGDAYRRQLIEKHGFKILTDGYTHITEEEYKTFRNDAETEYQINFLDQVFGRDEPELPTIEKGTPIWVKENNNSWWTYGKFHSFYNGKARLIWKNDTVGYPFSEYSLTVPEL